MDSGLLQQLIQQYGQGYEKKLEEPGLPMLTANPKQYLHRNPQYSSDFSGFLSDQIGARGTTDAVTGSMWFNPEHMANVGTGSFWDLGDFLSTVAHENYHAKRRNISRASKQALKNRSQEVMGGEGEYRKFLDSINPREDFWLYKLQSMIPFMAGQDRMDEEAIAKWIGLSSTGHSPQSFKRDIGKLNPKLLNLYDLHTNGLDLIQE